MGEEEMKCIVKTTGNFGLIQFGEKISAFRPSVVTRSSFVENRIALGQLKLVIGDFLPDAATDEEFAQYWKETEDYKGKDREVFAAESYLSKFVEEDTGQDDSKDEDKAPPPKKNQGKKKK